MKKVTIEALFQGLSKSIPEPKSDLQFENNFQLLIAVMLSAQTTDVSVNKATPELFRLAPTPQKMVELGVDKIRQCIKTIGLYNGKASNAYKTCKILVEKHNSQVPSTREELEALPGVGRKTAGVVLNVAFQENTIPVDTHVFRIANRTGLVKTKTPTETELKLLKLVPEWVLGKAHHLLILHGRYVCKAKKMLCSTCVIEQQCEFKQKS